jgi:hypothetical protein
LIGDETRHELLQERNFETMATIFCVASRYPIPIYLDLIWALPSDVKVSHARRPGCSDSDHGGRFRRAKALATRIATHRL